MAGADVDRLRQGLAAGGQRVEVRETHGSTAFLVDDRSYRLRKPVRFDFWRLLGGDGWTRSWPPGRRRR